MKKIVVLFFLCLTALTVWVLFYGAKWQILPLFLYIIPSNTFIFIPHEPGVIYLSKYLDPLSLSFAGMVGTLIAGLIDLHFISRMIGKSKSQRLGNHPWTKKVKNLFLRYPFRTIALCAFAPVPFYPIRVLAAGCRYSPIRYAGAFGLGRFPRYYLLAVTGAYLKLSPTWLIGLFVLSGLVAYWVYEKNRKKSLAI